MFITIILIILLIIILIDLYLKNIKENYSSLDIYYHSKDKKINPDICNKCGVLCQYCNHGKNKPNTCNRPINFYKRGYVNPAMDNKGNLKINLNAIASPKQNKCQDDQVINNLISANYIYIYSDAFNKSLAFESYGNKSYVFIDSKMPNPKKDHWLVGQDYEDYCNLDLNFEKHLPQKWRINIKSFLNPNQCLITISSYSCNGLKYYLTAHKDGKVSVSLFGGGNNQVWKIYPNKQDNTDRDDNLEYLIKSHIYCTYLSGTNRGYMRRNAGNVNLTNVKLKYVGKENIWKIMMCGNRKIDIEEDNINKYQPMNSTLDFPYVDDNIGPKNVVPPNIELSKNINKKWGGRNVWMTEFLNVWNTNDGNMYIYQIRLSQNFLCNINTNNTVNNNNQKIITKYATFNLPIMINMLPDKNYSEVSGKILIDIIKTSKENKNISGQLFGDTGLVDNKMYIQYNYIIEKQVFNVKSSGAGVLYGKGVNNNNIIFAEMIGKNPVRMRVTIRNPNQAKLIEMSGDIILQKMAIKGNTNYNKDIKFDKPVDC